MDETMLTFLSEGSLALLAWFLQTFKATFIWIEAHPLITGVIGSVAAALLLKLFQSKPVSPSLFRHEDREQRNRQAMIDKVRAIWITGFLDKSLEKEVRIALNLKENIEVVTCSLDLLGQLPKQTNFPLPPDKKIIDVYDEQNRHLLILGNPGAGKTILLLELARHLLERATEDQNHPIPVVFLLSSWVGQFQSLGDWLVDELNKKFDVRREIAQVWVDNNQILPMLDGLDEVSQKHRGRCIKAINSFRKAHGFLPLVICCRSKDYTEIGKRLRLQGAVTIQPLKREQVKSYLMQIGVRLEGLRLALRDDPELWDLLDTPLMLNVMTVAYDGQQTVDFKTANTLKRRREHLFATYVNRMFSRRYTRISFTQSQMLHWLAWLARQMVQRSQTVFYIERMQPDWFPRKQRPVFRSGLRLVGGLGGGLVFGLAFGLGGVPIGGLLYGLVNGLVFGLLGGLLGGLIFGRSESIEIVETVRWSWSQTRSSSSLDLGLDLGLLFGLLFWLGGGLVFGLLVGLLSFLFSIFMSGLSQGEIKVKTVPNQGIRRSAQNALVVGLGSGLLGGLIFGLTSGLTSGPTNRLVFGLINGLINGGKACFMHLLLRFFLVRNGSMPWNYLAFLDSATECLFTRKVGGGYTFIHRTLMEYFAELHTSLEHE